MEADSSNPKRLTYSVTETAKVLGISRSSAYAAIHKGEIPSIKMGRRFLVPILALEKILQR